MIGRMLDNKGAEGWRKGLNQAISRLQYCTWCMFVCHPVIWPAGTHETHLTGEPCCGKQLISVLPFGQPESVTSLQRSWRVSSRSDNWPTEDHVMTTLLFLEGCCRHGMWRLNWAQSLRFGMSFQQPLRITPRDGFQFLMLGHCDMLIGFWGNPLLGNPLFAPQIFLCFSYFSSFPWLPLIQHSTPYLWPS